MYYVVKHVDGDYATIKDGYPAVVELPQDALRFSSRRGAELFASLLVRGYEWTTIVCEVLE